MKMETVIRSPQNGVIKRLTHKEGVSLSVSSLHLRKENLTGEPGSMQGGHRVGGVRRGVVGVGLLFVGFMSGELVGDFYAAFGSRRLIIFLYLFMFLLNVP